jgi:hypothetical protein
MHPPVFLLCAAALFSGLPFWEATPAAEWSDSDVDLLLTNSPWAQQAVSGRSSTGSVVYLASARPIREAEAERDRRSLERSKRPPVEDPAAGEYADFLRDNEGKYIVLAVRLPSPKLFADAAEVKRMEEECVLKVGPKKYKMTGHFPPSPSDAWMRLVFPRVVTHADKSFRFELYIPAVQDPYRFAEFRVADMMYKGRLEL